MKKETLAKMFADAFLETLAEVVLTGDAKKNVEAVIKERQTAASGN